ncbi:HAD-IA family hydrolase [Sulfobacillus sp. hq2]|uniref:HAD-IA family hydrolase n=1 Tax=Sulfobacillus sp. hq2 TaxID=2039167 RepID=UPI000CD067B0|nr:HAD-IA family hydrolase [Sulfobacillus sp. hq2]POB11449.1 phosphatase [Sulfobacillus sp. hq2]
MPQSLKALIFDVDGTLADTEGLGHLWAFNQAFQEAGLPFVWDTDTYRVLLAVTGGERRIHHFLSTRPDLPSLSRERVAQLHQRKTVLFGERVQSGHVLWRPGTKRLIREAKHKGLKVGIATTTHEANVHALLQSAFGNEWPSWIDLIGAAQHVENKKPDPAIYHWVLQQWEYGPGDVIAFEDSSPGLLAARQAQIPTVITMNEWTYDHDFTGALAVLDNLGEPGAPARVLIPKGQDNVVVDCNVLQQWLEAER